MGSSSEYQAVVPVRVDPGCQGVDFGFSAIDVIGLGPLQVTVRIQAHQATTRQ